ncbi:MAG: hypothetical protein AB1483_08710 [Candidatus Zixiibacteriota bacterium]
MYYSKSGPNEFEPATPDAVIPVLFCHHSVEKRNPVSKNRQGFCRDGVSVFFRAILYHPFHYPDLGSFRYFCVFVSVDLLLMVGSRRGVSLPTRVFEREWCQVAFDKSNAYRSGRGSHGGGFEDGPALRDLSICHAIVPGASSDSDFASGGASDSDFVPGESSDSPGNPELALFRYFSWVPNSGYSLLTCFHGCSYLVQPKPIRRKDHQYIYF